jgi:hypothetical protein
MWLWLKRFLGLNFRELAIQEIKREEQICADKAVQHTWLNSGH